MQDPVATHKKHTIVGPIISTEAEAGLCVQGQHVLVVRPCGQSPSPPVHYKDTTRLKGPKGGGAHYTFN